MHILERYSLSCAAQIDEPYILEKFYPLPFEKYITFHPFSKPAKNYDYWQEVIDILHPQLEERGIHILQVGVKEDPPFKRCHHIQGKTSINQVAYLVRHALLHFGADSFPVHLASAAGTKIVALYSSCYSNNAKPYWTKDEDCCLIESNFSEYKPSFAFDENPKLVNTTEPEGIANAILKLLGIDYQYPYKTIYIGQHFKDQGIEMVPTQVINAQASGISSITVRMDYHFDEKVLEQQLLQCPCHVATNKPINMDILKAAKNRIFNVVYFLEEENDVEFIRQVHHAGIKLGLVSYGDDEFIDSMKLLYMDYGLVNKLPSPKKEDIEEIKDLPVEQLFYKSSKFTLCDGKTYPSEAAYKLDKPVDAARVQICPAIDHPDFWKQSTSFSFLTLN